MPFNPHHNQYFLEAHEALLDNPGEWYYDKDSQVLKFMPWKDACPNEDVNAIRGRVIDYFFDISNTKRLVIENLDFFASNLQVQSSTSMSSNIVLDSLRFNFPSSSKRMLHDFSVPKVQLTNITFAQSFLLDATQITIQAINPNCSLSDVDYQAN